MDPEEVIRDLTAKIEGLTIKAAELQDQLKKADETKAAIDLAPITEALGKIEAEMAPLTEARKAAEKDLEVKRLTERLSKLETLRTERKYQFNITTGAVPDDPFPIKLWKAKRGDREAAGKLDAEIKAAYAADIKALGEGTSAAGGYLVPPQYIQQLVMLRRATAPLLDYVTTINGVRSNLVYVPTQSTVETVAWTADNATKTSTDEVFAQISVNIFTLAGIAKVSNQLLEDSSPAVDSIVQQSLGRGLGIEMDRAIIAGTGTGQPTGILNTSGVTTTLASAQTAASILDDILGAIGRLQAAYLGQPDVIVMHPRTWAKLMTAKDTTNRYLSIGTTVGNQMMNLPGIPSPTQAGSNVMLFGIPVVIDANVPVALTVGANTNRSVVIVGALKETWALMRDDIRMDVSAEAGTSFESNQTWFRGECRMGFTAARLPSAIQVINDVGP
jgi:HK97 family phage major capsid protein